MDNFKIEIGDGNKLEGSVTWSRGKGWLQGHTGLTLKLDLEDF